MSDQQKPRVRAEEPELADEALEQVAGGCEINSQDHDVNQLTLPIGPAI